jgi:DegV family protein with EDD domain
VELNQPVALVTDSSVSLPHALVKNNPIFVAPIQLILNEITYQDGVDIWPNEFYRLLRTSSSVPTTAGVSPLSFQRLFTEISKMASTILCITIAKEFSSTYHAAILAMEQTKDTIKETTIHVIDSRTAGIAQGLIALEASEAIQKGSSVEQIRQIITRTSSNVEFIGFLSTLEYLRRSGRVSASQWFLSSLIRTKPMLELSNGTISPIGRPRTTKLAVRSLIELMKRRLGDTRCRIAIAHADNYNDASHLYQAIENTFNHESILVTDFTPAIGAHTGPGLVGCAFLKCTP